MGTVVAVGVKVGVGEGVAVAVFVGRDVAVAVGTAVLVAGSGSWLLCETAGGPSTPANWHPANKTKPTIRKTTTLYAINELPIFFCIIGKLYRFPHPGHKNHEPLIQNQPQIILKNETVAKITPTREHTAIHYKMG